MSILPNSMLEPQHPIGRVDENGYVLVEYDWWLMFFNLMQSVLANGQGLPASALIELASADSDAADADAVSLRQPLANAGVQALQPQDVVVTDADLPSIARALLLAQDGLLPDPVPAAQPVVAITVGGSPFSYTAPFSGQVSVTAGTVSLISIIRQGTTVATGQTAGLFGVSRGDQVQVTYTGTPTMRFLPT